MWKLNNNNNDDDDEKKEYTHVEKKTAYFLEIF